MNDDDLILNLKQARSRLWHVQERYHYFPDLVVIINDIFSFNFNSSGSCHHFDKSPMDWKTPYLKCYLKPKLLDEVLKRGSHWNNLEIGCHIEFDRCPNTYMPDVHTLMSFFHV